MSQIVENTLEHARLRDGTVEAKLDAIARHVADEARLAAEQSRMIAILTRATAA